MPPRNDYCARHAAAAGKHLVVKFAAELSDLRPLSPIAGSLPNRIIKTPISLSFERS
jgi:hypothetical protein